MESFGSTIAFTLFALLLVLLLAWLAIRLLAVFYGRQVVSGKRKLSVIESTVVSSRERIIVVRYRAKEYLLGSSTHGLVLLDSMDVADTQDEHTADRGTVTDQETG